MSRHLYGHSTSYGGGGYPFSSSSSYLSDGGAASYGAGDPYTASRYSSFDLDAERVPSLYSSQIVDRFRHTGGEVAGGVGAGVAAASVYSHSPWAVLDGRGIGAAASTMATVSGVKHPAEDLYHQNILGSHTVGQTESLFSTNPLVKRPRLDTASNLPIYPQRPGEKDCAHYMLTRTCKFGDNCKFDHPVWVPEGGIPDWKEVPFVPAIELLPQRPGEPDCPYYLKTQNCLFGFRCKFNHPKDKINAAAGGEEVQAPDNSVLPERPSEPTCSFYLKTGKCKFGANCKFHHPKDVQMLPTAGQDTVSVQHVESGVNNKDGDGGDAKPTKTFVPFTPALLHNSKGLPIRLGETDCPFYLKTGSCKYGSMCRYNHPDRISMNPPAVSTLAHSIMPSIPATLPLGVLNTATNLLPSIDPRLTQTSLGITPSIYPQRPGQSECDFYMKTGHCSFGERCKFHHPIDRSAPTALAAKQAVQQNVKLTLAGLPRREGSAVCPFYMKTGTCKYGAACKFDHPPPGEAIAMATGQGIGSTSVTETGEEEGATGATQ